MIHLNERFRAGFTIYIYILVIFFYKENDRQIEKNMKIKPCKLVLHWKLRNLNSMKTNFFTILY